MVLTYLDTSLLASEVHEEVAAVHVLGLFPGAPEVQRVQRVAVERTLVVIRDRTSESGHVRGVHHQINVRGCNNEKEVGMSWTIRLLVHWTSQVSHLWEHAKMAADVGLGQRCIVQGRVRGHQPTLVLVLVAWVKATFVSLSLSLSLFLSLSLSVVLVLSETSVSPLRCAQQEVEGALLVLKGMLPRKENTYDE